jgi:endoglycosylceramidase
MKPNSRPLLPHTSIDETLNPSLNGNAFEMQQKEIFFRFVDAKFAGLYYSWSTRVDVTWMDFVRRHSVSTPNALIWSVRCLSMFYIGWIHKDRDKVASSRSMYGRGLQTLSHALQSPTAVKSDATLAAAIMLSIYEMLDGTGPQSWLTHSSGISTLLRLRGPNVHKYGFGRTQLISCRGFLVADALIRAEPCFLAEAEWRSMLQGTIIEERKSGRGSWLGDLVENAFIEIAACPGLLARTRSMVAESRDTGVPQRELLVIEIIRHLERLKELHDQLDLLVHGPVQNAHFQDRLELVGPIPAKIANTLARSSLRGARIAIALLEQLLVLVQPNCSRWPAHVKPTSRFAYAWSASAVVSATRMLGLRTLGCKDKSDDSVEADQACVLDWPDTMALSMGMLALNPRSIDIAQYL